MEYYLVFEIFSHDNALSKRKGILKEKTDVIFANRIETVAIRFLLIIILNGKYTICQ